MSDPLTDTRTAASIPFVLGPLEALDAPTRRRLMAREEATAPEIVSRVRDILLRVRREGDGALRELTRTLDGVTLETFEVSRAAIDAALARAPAALRDALQRAADAIARVHRAFLPRPLEVEVAPGIVVGRRPDPVARAGVYAPGGRARYPSSVLMGAVPARVAGVGEIVLCTPPGRAGAPDDVLLAAAAIAKVDRVFALGGAQAIAAMAYGTASVPRVDRLVGPGNAWVAEAKRQVAGEVPVDAPAGPSELLVIDACGEPARVAAELVAQAEHDPLAAVVAVVIGETRARAVAAALRAAAEGAARRDVVTAALAARGAVLWCDTLEQAVAFANDFAPEHLLLAVDAPARVLGSVRHAGAVFLGESSSVVFGDYVTGANHTLPTGGAARAWSGLSTDQFVRWTSWQRVAPGAGAHADASTLATSEGLPGHAAAARLAGAAPPDPSLERPRAIRTDYGQLTSYATERDDDAPGTDVLDLSDNTNAFGVAPSALAALSAWDPAAASRYPAGEPALRAALARMAGVPERSVTVGCGSDDLLDAAFRALAPAGGRIAHGAPTFSMVPRFARANGLEVVELAPRPDGTLDVEGLLAAHADLVYVASPDNPTGRVHPRAALERLVAETRGIVVIDHAYVEFGGDDVTPAAATHDRLVVTRTLSKAFGLAGLRVGWAVAHPLRIEAIDKARGPFMVSAPGERAALAAVSHDHAWVAARAADVRALRERFADALREQGFAPPPSGANFVLVPVADAGAAAATLARAGIRVRAFRSLPGAGDALRITLAPWPVMERVLAALAEVTPCA